jgi:hypothetical protein
LQKIGRHIVMPTRINDAGFRQFLFDTGASISSIDRPYVDSLGLAIQEDDCESGEAETGEIPVCPLRANELREMQVGNVPSTFVPAPVIAINLGFVLPGYDIQGATGCGGTGSLLTTRAAKSGSTRPSKPVPAVAPMTALVEHVGRKVDALRTQNLCLSRSVGHADDES